MRKYIPQTWQDMKRLALIVSFSIATFFLVLGASPTSAQTSQSESVGLTGTISAPPPTQGATITIPSSGQSFTDVPIPVRGLCPTGLLVKLFKNNVFAGSVQCTNGTFELSIDLFTGTNELIARVYDDLDQPGPDSNTVNVEFVDPRKGAGTRVSVTSNFAKRGANPGQTLTWPIIISGGSGPYAISVDWGDGKSPDLLSQPFPGTLDVKHVYDAAGVYNIVIKVSDSNGAAAFLQVVGIANGPLSQTNADGSPLNSEDNGVAFVASGKTTIVWWPATITVPFIISTFWLGKRYMLRVMKKRIERGEHPFSDI
ncbi:hypothetical protein KC992_01100 [Candidatus Saccharibacteria bacterium]|nr:hypothetical protein [Candidatus Saccharibacteria bacterium]